MQSILSQYSASQIEKAKKIKAIICDVDGVLTDGGIIYDNAGNEYKKFFVKDGQIIKHVSAAGILIGAITGRESEVVKFRCTEMKFDFHHHGIKDKYATYLEIRDQFQLKDEEIAYLGDDIIDLPILKKCGLSITPADAISYVKQNSDITTEAAGGKGVLREAADFILAAKGLLNEIIGTYCL